MQKPEYSSECSDLEGEFFYNPVIDKLDFETRVLVNPEQLPCPEAQNAPDNLPVVESAREDRPTKSILPNVAAEESLPRAEGLETFLAELDSDYIDPELDSCSKSDSSILNAKTREGPVGKIT